MIRQGSRSSCAGPPASDKERGRLRCEPTRQFVDISPNSALRPSPGRFLAVDPIEGGCANNYAYVFGDPVNGSDLNGQAFWDDVAKLVSVVAPIAGCALFGPAGCVAGAAIGLAARTGARANRCGVGSVFSRDTLVDALVTGAAAGLVAAPLAAVKSGLGLTGAFRQVLNGAFGEAARRGSTLNRVVASRGRSRRVAASRGRSRRVAARRRRGPALDLELLRSHAVVIRGMVPLRVVAFVLGSGCLVSAPLFLFSIPDIIGASDLAAVLLVIVLPLAIAGAYFAVKSLEFLRITQDSLEIRNPVRQPRLLPWDQVAEVELIPDVMTVIPVIRTTSGQSIKLRGAASFRQGEGSAAVRAYEAIRGHIS